MATTPLAPPSPTPPPGPPAPAPGRAGATPGPTLLGRLAGSCARHRRGVIVAWLAVIVGAVLAGGALGGDYADGGRLEGTDSDRAYQLWEQHVAADPDGSATMVFHAEGGLAARRAPIEAFLVELRAVPGVTGTDAPLAPGTVSPDGTVAFADVTFDSGDPAVVERIAAAADALRAQGVDVDFSSFWFQEGGVPASEGVGLLAAAVILLVAFGSVVAMGLPLLTAVAGITIGLAAVALLAHVMPTPDFTVQVASMVGIGVGIDYALFIVTRHREALARTGDVHASVVEAISTAGRAVVFAGCTVMVSLLGMFLMGLPFLYGLAVGTSSAVAVAVLAAVTLLPALLAGVGHRLDRLSVHRPSRRGRRAETVWHRWSRAIQRRPAAAAAGGLAVLVLLGGPALAMRQASADLGNDPVGTTTRTAYDRLAAGFGPGFNGPLLLVSTDDDLRELTSRVAATPGVAHVGEPFTSADGAITAVRVVPATGPQDEATADLVHHLRHAVIPASGVAAHVGGATASDVDFADRMSARLPVFIAAVLGLSFVLLLCVFRSVLVPLKAVVLNLLSIGAAYGVLVMVFQWGWLGSVVGIDGGAPIEPWAPMMLFAIVFGLSMDYEVFLLSSVKERHDAGVPNGEAVVEGLAATARVITAAAAIMVCVFGSFVLGDLRAIKLIGLGLAVAVLVDATVVRMVLVPATMELLGDRNWWLPRRLQRMLPRMAAHAPSAPAQVP